MRRRKLFKFKLTKKQRQRIVVFTVFCLIAVGVYSFYKHHARFWIHAVAPQIGKPKVTFVVDDIGYQNRFTPELEALGPKVTYAILPLLRYSRYYGHLSQQTHAEVILHLPLDSIQDKNPGPGLIVSSMPDDDIKEMLARDLDSVPNYVEPIITWVPSAQRTDMS